MRQSRAKYLIVSLRACSPWSHAGYKVMLSVLSWSCETLFSRFSQEYKWSSWLWQDRRSSLTWQIKWQWFPCPKYLQHRPVFQLSPVKEIVWRGKKTWCNGCDLDIDFPSGWFLSHCLHWCLTFFTATLASGASGHCRLWTLWERRYCHWHGGQNDRSCFLFPSLPLSGRVCIDWGIEWRNLETANIPFFYVKDTECVAFVGREVTFHSQANSSCHVWEDRH